MRLTNAGEGRKRGSKGEDILRPEDRFSDVLLSNIDIEVKTKVFICQGPSKYLM